jgi:serine protease Do
MPQLQAGIIPVTPYQQNCTIFFDPETKEGVVVDPGGLILTAAHVLVEDSDYYVTTAERKVYRAAIKAADPRSDLAVLAVEATDLRPIALGDADRLRKGQIVVALGNPFGIARDGQASASWGIVANLHRKAPAVCSIWGWKTDWGPRLLVSLWVMICRSFPIKRNTNGFGYL